MPIGNNPETPLAIAALLVAVVAARFGWQWLAWWERPLAKIARRRWLAIACATALPLTLRAALLPWYPIPEPRVHDEFTFLFEADTFLSGRVSNPQHPFWMHFQVPHILATPAYAASFPMGPAAVLALGRLLFGHAWFGVWLSAGLACGAICWMLQQWVPARWAFLGALLAVLKFGISTYWMNSYWGGFVAAAGGALALGALGWLIRTPDWRAGAVMGIGLAILANSRPVEGAVFGVGLAMVLFANRSRRLWPAIVPMAVVLAITGVWMGYCFARVTGKPWIAPYVLYRESMTIAPHFIFQSPRPQPLYNNRELRSYYVGREMIDYRRARTLKGFDEKLAAYWRFYSGPLLVLPQLVAVLFLWRNRKTRRLAMVGFVFFLALAPQVWHNVHYAAPATGLAILVAIQGMRALRSSRQGWAINAVWCLPMAAILILASQVLAGPGESGWQWPGPGGVARAKILRQLKEMRGKHLVLVRYDVRHDMGDEWVYNEANVDQSQVVWARELDRESNARLMQYYADRRVWLVEPDFLRIEPYESAPPHLMPFVAIGAPGIEVLRSPDEVRSRLFAKTVGRSAMTCTQWNWFFSDMTGVEAPDASGCRGEIGFAEWFGWLLMQR
jgi:hypothetical protein